MEYRVLYIRDKGDVFRVGVDKPNTSWYPRYGMKASKMTLTVTVSHYAMDFALDIVTDSPANIGYAPGDLVYEYLQHRVK